MRCVSYDYDFENDLTTKWQALDHPTPQGLKGSKRSGAKGRRGRRKRRFTPDDSEDEDDVPLGGSLDQLPRNSRREKHALHHGDVASGSEESSDDDEDDLYHDADGGNLSDYW